MKKLLRIILVLLVLLIVAVPIGLAIGVKRAVLELVNALNLYPGVSASLVEHRQGYFSSDASLKITLDNHPLAVPAQPSQPLVLDARLHLQHGPLIWTPRISFGWAHLTLSLDPVSGFQPAVTMSQQGPWYQLAGNVNLLGDIHFTDTMAAFAVDTTGIKLSASQSQGQGVLSLLQQKLEYTSSQTQFSFENADLRLALANPQSTKRVKWGKRGIALDNVLSFDALVEDKAANLLIKKGRFSLASQPSEVLAEQDVQFGIIAEEWKSNYAPLNQLDLNARLTHVPTQFIQQLSKSEFWSQADHATAPALFELIKTHLLPAKSQLIIDRLTLGPDGKTAQINLEITLPQVVELDWQEFSSSPAKWVPLFSAKGQLMMDKNLLQMLAQNIALAQSSADMNTQMAQQIKNQTTMMTGLFLGQGLMVEQNGAYQTRVTLDKGTLTLNEKPFLLPFY